MMLPLPGAVRRSSLSSAGSGDTSPASASPPDTPPLSPATTFAPRTAPGTGLPPPATQAAPADAPGADARQRALDALGRSARAQADAARVGVRLAEASFLTRWGGLILASVNFTLSLAATIATGGAAAPMLAVSSYYLLQAAGDAWCAARCWKDEQARQADPSHKPTLPMGASVVSNLLYFAAEGLGCEPERAKAVARRGAFLLTGVMGVLAVFAGSAAPAASGTVVAIKLATASAQSLVQPFEIFFPIVRKLSAQTGERLEQAQAEKAVADYLEKVLEETGGSADAAASMLDAQVPRLLDDAFQGGEALAPAEKETLRQQLQDLVRLGKERALRRAGGQAGGAYRSLHPPPETQGAAQAEAEALRVGSRGIVLASALRGVALGAIRLAG